MQGRMVILGKIGAPFGVRGWVKVTSYTDPPEGIAGYGDWLLIQGSTQRPVRVLEWKTAGRGLAVRLEGVDDRDQAQRLTHAEIGVDREALPATEPGEFYWDDLVGMEAVNGEGQALGTVDGFLELPAHPVLVLKGDRERLVPLVRERLLKVDVEARRLTLDWHPDD
jgi:16S rRNA processing protein RimM